ncbi:MAG TPA: diguanylate cyclase [Longimicrobiaceae bacterium]
MSTTAARGRPPALLVLSRTEWLARSFESILLPDGFAVIRARDADDAVARFEAERPALALLESENGDGAAALCRRLRAHPRLGHSTPIVVVCAGAMARSERLGALRAGAWDAMGFPLDPEELLLKVRALAAVRREVTAAEERGLLDPETGLYNARGMALRAQEMLADAYRHRRPLACVMVAATPGTGDPAGEANANAAVFGRLLRAVGRGSDVIGRMRETEFAVLAPCTGWDGAARLGERVHDTLVRELERTGGSGTVEVYCGRYAVDGIGGTPRVHPLELLVHAEDDLHAASTPPAPADITVAAVSPALATAGPTS